jgi:hypothetical protein
MLGCLKVACHMGATPSGRSCIAASNCLPRWLPRAHHLQPQLLQLLLMLPHSCMTDWTEDRDCWQALYRGGRWGPSRLSSSGVSAQEYQATVFSPSKQKQVCFTVTMGPHAGVPGVLEGCINAA